MSTPAPAKPYKIVVGFDFSSLAERAVEEAVAIASRRLPAELHIITVAEPVGLLVQLPGTGSPMNDDAARETVRVRIAKIIDDYQAHHGPIGIERAAIYVLTGLPAGEPAKLITDLAEAVDADLVVIGTHGRTGFKRLLLGSVAERVVRNCPTSVHVVRPADYVRGEKVPDVEPPLTPGQPHLKHFEHRRTYHQIDRVSHWTNRTMPVS